ncbi:MAG TPA: fumarylacetoacetate hydrolase family protein [Ramlibacter sp.]|nr:fumarylacetoacetate hydrolase family protein [Ramlibacter sp.]
MNFYNLGRYRHDGRIVVGRPNGSQVDVLRECDDLPGALAECDAATPAVASIPAGATTLLAPLDAASRVFAIAVNYRAHGMEAKTQPPVRPLIFYKPPSNFVAPGAALRVNRALVTKFDYEGEIGIVIGRACKDATVENALDYVVGVCALNDGSARNLGRVGLGSEPGAATWPDWTAAKGIDGASALGPTISCGSEVVQALRDRTLRIRTRLNGETVQDGDMSEMIFSCEEIIATLSSYMALQPGDVIATGTPAGVGIARNRFLDNGDRLEVQVSEFESLVVTVE